MTTKYKTVRAHVNTPEEVDEYLLNTAKSLNSEGFEVVSHCVYKDDHSPYTLILSVLAKKTTLL